MDPLLEQYEPIGRGEVPPPVDYNEYKRLLAHAKKFVSHEDIEQRLLAVSVAGAIGGSRGMYTVRMFLKDSEVAVRRRCLEVGVADGETGITLLRAILDDADEAVVLETIQWLRRAADRGSAGNLRRTMRHESAEVRTRAAEFLGHIAGPSVISAVRPLTSDPDEGVRAAATEAIERLEGNLAQDEPDIWWGVKDITGWTPPEPVPLPDPLPTDNTAELLRVLARASEDDRQSVLDALTANYSSADISRAVRKARPDEDRPLSVGAALAGRIWERRDWVVPLRRLLTDDDPWVRITVIDTLALIGTASVVPGVRQLLGVAQPEVRAASIHCLHALCGEDERERYFKVLEGDQTAPVLQALAVVRGEEVPSEADPAEAAPDSTPGVQT